MHMSLCVCVLVCVCVSVTFLITETISDKLRKEWYILARASVHNLLTPRQDGITEDHGGSEVQAGNRDSKKELEGRYLYGSASSD